ncbi:hypothetical protein [Paenibacillus sp. NPDC093718]|uniref:hypothetical protein n=1 Tax=Paenibacillus sp. NPDC093718 TaxID=3390601 RepID=UPI003D056A0E
MSTDKVALLEQKIDEYGRKIKSLEDQLQAVMRAIDMKNDVPEDREWVSNSAGDWSIKVVYPGIYTQTHESYPTAGFPKNRKKTAEQVTPGQMMFIYATNPVKRVIGMTRVTSTMKEVGGQWPYSVDLEWVLGPKQGITFAEAGLDIRPRIGDTLYAITEEAAHRMIDLLEKQPDLTEETIAYLSSEYKTQLKVVTHKDAIKRLREAGMDEVADALEDFKADDGSVRGWDEKIERGDLYRRYPKAREIIWPEEYGI